MKKLIHLTSIALVIVSCSQEEKKGKGYVTLSGAITNPNSDSLVVEADDIIKVIKVNTDGAFKDTLKVKADNYYIFDGTEGSEVYLKNGYNLNITLNTNEFDESLEYSGIGAEPNNILAEKVILKDKLYQDYESVQGDSVKFEQAIKTFKDSSAALLKKADGLDTKFVTFYEEDTQFRVKQFREVFEQEKAILAMNGSDAPKFVAYENHAGGTTSLDDLRGEYVYIDLWATWCGPCKAEIPYLKAIEKEYDGKNINFVSISIDSKEDHDKWRTMVDAMELTGIQLFWKEDKTFVDEYQVVGIPRFILIGPDGKTINANAPGPSSDALKNIFSELNIGI